MKLVKNIFGTRNQRILKGYEKKVAKINALEAEIQALSDEQLRAKTDEFKQRVTDGESLDALLFEAFAVVREASRRVLGMRHFDVQLIGGMTLHEGKIAEMRTGEGKTLAATLPSYLNAMTGESVHVITVNDYLVKRDAEWMQPVYEFLGLTVGINISGMEPEQKKAAYATDVLYGTNNEFGFDYLRDNMVFSLDDRVQRPLSYAVIDEVDSILIDEARTPLIISGQAEESSDLYAKIGKLIPKLSLQKMTEGQKEDEVPEEDRGDYYLDEKNKQAYLTEQGHQHIEKLMQQIGLLGENESLYDIHHVSLMHYIFASLRAHTLYSRDVDYVVKDNQVIIVDEHTGRLMDGRRWSEGLHQAVEAKENVQVQLENQTLATITFQNYFRIYKKLSGMTGTADTEAFELQKIYGLEVVVIPTNKPMVRKDEADMVFLSQTEKFKSILQDIKECKQTQQPVLVGTASIENSEILANFLKQENIQHEVLNAKQHEREAKIIEDAGRPGAVTIATNMAGRGTDIVLGGNLEEELAALPEDATEQQKQAVTADWQKRHDKVLEAGGLYVLGTERHESRRIDNQLRGRSGRQGDPGRSRFYLSLEDNLMRIFAAERMSAIMRKLGVKEGDVIQHPMISNAIEKAQRRVEGLNFDIRKNLLEFDDVANDQRKVIYQQRLELLQRDDIASTVMGIREESITSMIDTHVPPQSLEEQWDVAGLENQIYQDFGLRLPIAEWLDKEDELHEETLRERIHQQIIDHYQQKEEKWGAEVMRDVEKSLMLQLLDSHWKEHLAAMDHLRQGIHLRGYAQKNPTQEYKRESFEMFQQFLDAIKYEFVSTLSKLEISAEPQSAMGAYPQPGIQMSYHHAEMDAMQAAPLPNPDDQQQAMTEEAGEPQQPYVRNQPKVGRNDSCPCGSGKKYKQCCGRLG